MAKNKTVKLDAQGRVLIPPHIRKEMGLTTGQDLEVDLDGGTIRIQPAYARCDLCGESGEHLTLEEYTIGPVTKRICNHCAACIANAKTTRG